MYLMIEILQYIAQFVFLRKKPFLHFLSSDLLEVLMMHHAFRLRLAGLGNIKKLIKFCRCAIWAVWAAHQ